MNDNNCCPVCKRPTIEIGETLAIGTEFKCKICGNFNAGQQALEIISTIPGERRWLLSAWINEKSPSGETPIIHPKFLKDEFPRIALLAVEEKITKCLLYLANKSKYAGHSIDINLNIDYARYWSSNPVELRWILNELQNVVYVHFEKATTSQRSITLTSHGWSEVNRLRREVSESDQIFVAMWFDHSMDDVYENAIRAAIEHPEVGYRALRIDNKEHSNKIDDEIILEIRRSRAVVADFTKNRGGVYFEAGFAKGLGKPVIWTCQKSWLKKVHFDTRQFNHIPWADPDELCDKLKKRILAEGI